MNTIISYRIFEPHTSELVTLGWHWQMVRLLWHWLASVLLQSWQLAVGILKRRIRLEVEAHTCRLRSDFSTLLRTIWYAWPHGQARATQKAARGKDEIGDEADELQRFARAPRTRLYSLSRWLLKILRHTPEAAGLSMDANGWIQLDQITRTLPDHLAGFALLPVEYLVNLIEHILWQRVQLTGDSVRATYGHTSQQFAPTETQIPDAPLFHGTAWERWPLIQHAGLNPAGRRFVQLTTDFDYANRIANAHSAHPLVLQVATHAALDAGVKFFNFGIHVWQCTAVPSDCLQQWSTNALPNDFWLGAE